MECAATWQCFCSTTSSLRLGDTAPENGPQPSTGPMSLQPYVEGTPSSSLSLKHTGTSNGRFNNSGSITAMTSISTIVCSTATQKPSAHIYPRISVTSADSSAFLRIMTNHELLPFSLLKKRAPQQ